MNDFFRIQIPPEIAAAGPTTLARLTHEAEETDDDILLMQVQGALQSRDEVEQDIYRESYFHQWKQRMDARKAGK